MWHVKTSLGTFWILETDEKAQKYYLGCDDETIAEYDSIDTLLDDVCNQETGYQRWDKVLRVKSPPNQIEAWDEGPPENW